MQVVADLEADLEGGPNIAKKTKDKSVGIAMPRKVKLTMVEVKDSPGSKPRKLYVLSTEEGDDLS